MSNECTCSSNRSEGTCTRAACTHAAWARAACTHTACTCSSKVEMFARDVCMRGLHRPAFHLLPPTSYLRHPTSYLPHPTSYLLPPISYILHLTSSMLTSYLLPPTALTAASRCVESLVDSIMVRSARPGAESQLQSTHLWACMRVGMHTCVHMHVRRCTAGVIVYQISAVSFNGSCTSRW